MSGTSVERPEASSGAFKIASVDWTGRPKGGAAVNAAAFSLDHACPVIYHWPWFDPRYVVDLELKGTAE